MFSCTLWNPTDRESLVNSSEPCSHQPIPKTAQSIRFWTSGRFFLRLLNRCLAQQSLELLDELAVFTGVQLRDVFPVDFAEVHFTSSNMKSLHFRSVDSHRWQMRPLLQGKQSWKENVTGAISDPRIWRSKK